MQTGCNQRRVVGDEANEHSHPPAVHSPDHNHAPLKHAHKDRAEDDERQEHAAMAHIHDHESPTGEGL